MFAYSVNCGVLRFLTRHSDTCGGWISTQLINMPSITTPPLMLSLTADRNLHNT